MTTEMTMLTYAVALLIALVLLQATSGVLAQGLMPMAGHRDDLPAPKPFQARMLRVVDNHREGLIMFAPLVLVAAFMNLSNTWTVLGAQMFFYGRLAHAIIYVAGWPLIRPLAWAVGIAGTVLILLTLLGILN